MSLRLLANLYCRSMAKSLDDGDVADSTAIREKAIGEVRDAVLEDVAEHLEIMAASPLGDGASERVLRLAVERVRKLKG